ncbi:MAG: hypothetical protein JTJ12_13050 [Eubacterium sp.]|nr:hypothetical protein [Eubacterium sp.]
MHTSLYGTIFIRVTVTIHELIGARRVGKSTIAESFAMPQAVEAYVNGKNFAGDFLPILIGRI